MVEGGWFRGGGEGRGKNVDGVGGGGGVNDEEGDFGDS